MTAINISLPGVPFQNLPSVNTVVGLRLRASIGLTQGENIVVNGSGDPDAGSGLYRWDAASIADDNGKTVVKPADRVGSTAGRWLSVTAASGSGGNLSVATLEELKGADPESGTASLTEVGNEGLFIFTAGDYTGQADDINIVQQDDTPLSEGAWVRQRATSITALLNETGAVAITQEAKNASAISLFDFIPQNLHASILGRTVNNTKAAAEALSGYIQAGMDAAAAKRRALTVPAGLYNIAPVANFAAEGGACKRCFAIRSNMEIVAELGASFRIVNSISTDAAPQFMCMFGTNEQLKNVSVYGLEMDMNGANNRISPNRNNPLLPNNGYSLLNQAQFFVSGTPGGNAALISNASIEYSTFSNTPGVSCLVLAQSNVFDVALGRGWRIVNNTFRNNGGDTVDHSTIYGWANGVDVHGNVFENDVQFNVTGGLVAYEVHGSDTHFHNNTVSNYFQGMWIDGNFTESVKGVLIDGNKFLKMAAFGILYFGRTAALSPVSGSNIINNRIEFDDSTQPGIDQKIGIGATSDYTQVGGFISGNRVVGGGTTVASAAVSFAAGVVAGQKHDKMVISGNVADRTTFGVTLSTTAAAGLGTFAVTGNTFLNLTAAGAFAFPTGIATTGNLTTVIDNLILADNQCIEDRLSGAGRCAFGIRLEGLIGRLSVSNNRASGMQLADYAEAGTVVTTRTDSKFQGIDASLVKIGGTQVLSTRGAAVPDAAVDADTRTTLNTLLARLRAHGLIAA